MSQPLSSTTDTQSLLQSMLQRLRLQPGSEGPVRSPLHSPTSASQDWDLNGTSGALHTQSGVMVGTTTTGLEPPRTNDIISKPVVDNSNLDNHIHYGSPRGNLDSMDEYGTSASDYTFKQRTVGRDGKEHSHYVLPKQQQDTATPSFTYHSLPSSPSPRGNILAAGDRELGQAELSQATPAGTQTGRDLPAGHSHGIRHVSDRDTDVISCLVEESEGNDRNRSAEVACDTDMVSMEVGALNGKLDQVFLGGPATLSLPAASPWTSLTSNQGCQMSKVVVESPKMERNQNHDSPSTPIYQGFTPKVWTWSLKSVDSGVGTGSDVEKSLPLDNGELQVSDQSQDVDIFSVSESTPRTKKEKRLSDSTKRKWTQRIKDRWRDRRGSLGKRGKELTGVDEEKKKEGDFPSPNQTAAGDHGVLLSNVEEVKFIQSARTTAHDDAPGLVTEVCDMPETVRSTSEVEFSLGSFSLLEEIFTGQEWARFLNPTQANIPTNKRPVEEAANQPKTPVGRKDQGNALSGLNLTPTRNNEWGFRLNEVNNVSERRITQMPSDNSVPTNMDIPESSQVQEARSEIIQPMEHGQDQTDEVGPNHFLQSDFSFIKPAEVLDKWALKSRIHLNRKRGHQPQESNTEGEREQGELLDSGEAEEDLTTTQRKERDNSNLIMSLYPLKSSPSTYNSACSPTFVPRGVLKHSISQDSQCSSSMETVTKKRRVEDSRRVRFSEDVVSIEPHVLLSDSEVDSEEEDSSLEEDAFLYEDVKMEQVEEVIPARRHPRLNWMLALKKKHLGKKPQL